MRGAGVTQAWKVRGVGRSGDQPGGGSTAMWGQRGSAHLSGRRESTPGAAQPDREGCPPNVPATVPMKKVTPVAPATSTSSSTNWLLTENPERYPSRSSLLMCLAPSAPIATKRSSSNRSSSSRCAGRCGRMLSRPVGTGFDVEEFGLCPRSLMGCLRCSGALTGHRVDSRWGRLLACSRSITGRITPVRALRLLRDSEPAAEVAGLDLRRLVPTHPQRPQEPEPAQQIHPIRALGRGRSPARR